MKVGGQQMNATETIALIGVCGTILFGLISALMGLATFWHGRDALTHQHRHFVYGKQYDEYAEILRLTHKVVTYCRSSDMARITAIIEFNERLSIWSGI